MDNLEKIIKNTTEESQSKVDWTKAWSGKYPVLKTYQSRVDIPRYAAEIRKMFQQLQNDYGYSELDAMLVLKDILAHEYMDKKKQSREN
ncbi:MAG: hypothetical protein MRZ45_07715 [Blautia sp.]|nr:hypothetical protein [Blautia sp.]MDY4516293.1 hypothetical protein [Lachnospiraceae bacterium]